MLNLMNPGNDTQSIRTTAQTLTPAVRWNRELPGSAGSSGEATTPLNLMLIVGLALFISVLARYLSTRRRK